MRPQPNCRLAPSGIPSALLLVSVAEDAGFEPARAVNPTRFPSPRPSVHRDSRPSSHAHSATDRPSASRSERWRMRLGMRPGLGLAALLVRSLGAPVHRRPERRRRPGLRLFGNCRVRPDAVPLQPALQSRRRDRGGVLSEVGGWLHAGRGPVATPVDGSIVVLATGLAPSIPLTVIGALDVPDVAQIEPAQQGLCAHRGSLPHEQCRPVRGHGGHRSLLRSVNGRCRVIHGRCASAETRGA
jgi:hypothetical protein